MHKDKDKRHDSVEADELVRLTEDLDRRNATLEARLREQEDSRAALLHLLEELDRERARIEQARREWVTALDGIQDPIFIHDKDMRVVRANRAYAARAGVDVREVVGRRYWEMFPKLGAPLPSCQQVIEERQEAEEMLRLPTGEEFVSRAFPIHDAEGHYLYSLHVLVDVTEKRKAEAEQRVLSEALRQAAEAAIVLDSEQRITYVNPAFQRMLGYTPGEILGKPLSILSVPGLPDPLQPMEVARRVHESGWWHGEVQRRAKDGTAVPVLLSASAIRNEKDAVTGYVGTYLDLRAIRNAEQRFRSLIENSSDIVSLLDREGTLRYLSPTVQRLLGYAPEELVGTGVFALVHPDDVAQIQQVFAEALRNPGKVYQVECRVRRKDGSYCHTETVGRNLLDDPAVAGIVINTRDATYRKAAEAALHESEERFRSISNTAQDAVVMLDDDSRIVYWNPGAQRIFGYAAEEVLGRELHPLLAPTSYQDDIRKGWAQFRDTGTGQVIGKLLELTGLRKDGTEFPVELSVSALRLKGRWHAVGVLRDITRRRRAEVALRESEEKFRALVETTTDWIWQVDEHGVYTYASPQVRDILGYEPEEIVGKTPFDLMPPSEAERMREILKSIVASQKPFRLLENVNLRKNGRTVVLETSGTPLFDQAGAYKGCRGIDRDITERKRSEESLLDLNRMLKTLSACNAALVHATRELELLEEICRISVHQGGYRLAWVGFAVQDEAKRVVPQAAAGVVGLDVLRTLNVTWDDGEHGQGPTGRAIRTGRGQVVQDVTADAGFDPWREQIREYGIASAISLPLHSDGEFFGALSIYAGEPNAFDAEEVSLLTELADDLAFGILTLRARAAHERLQEEHLKSAERIKETLTDTIRAIALTVEKRDPYTAGHQQKVAALCVAIGLELGLDENRLEGLRLGVTIHDIGKIYVPAEILNRPGKLTPAEFEMIKSHPEVGYDIIKDVKFPWPVGEMILQHHERLDGSGYPKGLKGEDIILEARILAVADTVEAMSAHRPYRPGLGIEVALDEIAEHRGTWYDASAVGACVRLFREKGFRFS